MIIGCLPYFCIDSLLSLKKSQLLKQLDDTEDEVHSDQRSQGQGHFTVHANTSSTNANVEMDEEYASFQVLVITLLLYPQNLWFGG